MSELEISSDGETVPVAVVEEGSDRFVQFVDGPGLALGGEDAVERRRLHDADLAAVDHEDVAGDVVRRARAEPDDHRGDVLDRPRVDLIALRWRRERRLRHGRAA